MAVGRDEAGAVRRPFSFWAHTENLRENRHRAFSNCNGSAERLTLYRNKQNSV